MISDSMTLKLKTMVRDREPLTTAVPLLLFQKEEGE